MSLFSVLRLNGCLQLFSVNKSFKFAERLYAKTILGALTGKAKLVGGTFEKKKRLPVETDAHKLVNFCCGSNIYKEGDDVRLKDDSEYPDWLWQLRLGPPKLDDMDPGTKEYWELIFHLHRIRELRMKGLKTKKKMFVNEGDKMFALRKLRFRALAYKYDAGYDTPPRFDKAGWRIIKM